MDDDHKDRYDNLLLIVDPQLDFITGSLKVKDAVKVMDFLLEWIDDNISKIDIIVVTMDWHPYNHCSFEKNGGIWPIHCVKDSVGASIYSPLSKKLEEIQKKGNIRVEFIKKATEVDSEQYSAFQENLPEYIFKTDKIYISGIAGDVCVRYTVSDIRSHGYSGKLEYIKNAIAYINEETKYE